MCQAKLQSTINPFYNNSNNSQINRGIRFVYCYYCVKTTRSTTEQNPSSAPPLHHQSDSRTLNKLPLLKAINLVFVAIGQDFRVPPPCSLRDDSYCERFGYGNAQATANMDLKSFHSSPRLASISAVSASVWSSRQQANPMLANMGPHWFCQRGQN